jgi:hypothetical protein
MKQIQAQTPAVSAAASGVGLVTFPSSIVNQEELRGAVKHIARAGPAASRYCPFAQQFGRLFTTYCLNLRL